MSKVLKDYIIPGTNLINFTAYSHENIPKPPHKYKVGDTVKITIETEITELHFDCDGTPLYSLVNLGHGFSDSNMELIAEGAGKNVVVSNLAGTSSYTGGHLKIGAQHIWTDSATGKQFTKSTAPASGQDGSMMGVISGTDTFAAATTKVVTIGSTMAAATYKVTIAPNSNRTIWVTNKTTTQFTLNAAGANSDSVDWMVHV